ncbi:hypothetical protein [Roseobacter litoralis]|uniref:hypothetical protein n=1 Tax=Roseobacter litoralis TaxID=42443 RepID=UPI002490B648|nr:hypothetical protein [Roseobacter litoralis]
MTFERAFTRPLLMRVTENGSAFVEILAERAETDPALAAHLLESLEALHNAMDLDTDGIPTPKINEN